MCSTEMNHSVYIKYGDKYVLGFSAVCIGDNDKLVVLRT